MSSIDELYNRLAAQIYKNPNNRSIIEKSKEPEIIFNNSLQTILHRLLILALMKKRNMLSIFAKVNSDPDSLFSRQIADQLSVDDNLSNQIIAYLESSNTNMIIYTHEKLTQSYFLLNQDGSIQLTAAKRKKAGVFYTPAYIVQYIIDNTLGSVITGWTDRIAKGPEEWAMLIVEFKQFKILDPSCGSGVFLAAAAEKLDQFYNFYNSTVCKHSLSSLAIECSGLFMATYNIYGVDIDSKVVEITIYNLLSLLAKKNPEKVTQIYKQLVNNIKASNFLHFPDKNKNKFDLIIGNPPYVSNRAMDPVDKRYISDKYICAKGQYDLIIPFIEGALNLLEVAGQIGFILPNKYLAADYGFDLRKLIVQQYNMELIVDASSARIFGDAAVYPVIQIIKNEKKIKPDNNVRLLKQKGENNPQNLSIIAKTTVPQSFFANEKFIITTELNNDNYPIIAKILLNQGRLEAKHILCGIAQSGFARKIINYDEHKILPREIKSQYKRIVQVNNIRPYRIDYNQKYIHQKVTGAKLWSKFNGPKLLISGMAKELTAAIDLDDSALGRVYFIKSGSMPWDIYFLLGLLNSAIIRFFYKIFFWPVHLQGGYLRFNSTYLAQIPIPEINANHLFYERDNLIFYEQIVSAAQDMELATQQGVMVKAKQTTIDFLVGRMYGLNENETKYIIKLQSGGENG